jgi:hypothetical protein
MDEEIKKEFEKVWKKMQELELNKTAFSLTVKDTASSSNSIKSLNIKEFSIANEINEESLRTFIDFQPNQPRLTNIPKDAIRTQIQFKAILILGIIYEKIYDQNLSNQSVIDLFCFSKIPTERMDKLYESPMFTKYFSKSGKDIKLSWAGEKEAIKMLKETVAYGKFK